MIPWQAVEFDSPIYYIKSHLPGPGKISYWLKALAAEAKGPVFKSPAAM